MVSSLGLIDPHVDGAQRASSVAMGLHGLHRYAAAKWLFHLEQLSRAYGTPDKLPNPHLVARLDTLCERHDSILQHKHQRSINCATDRATDVRLTAFSDLQQFCILAELIWKQERRAVLSSDSHSQGMFEPPSSDIGRVWSIANCQLDDEDGTDPTLFTEVSNSYNAITHELLALDSEVRFPNVPGGHIRNFRATYGDTPYPCRLLGCSQRSMGFATENERNQHERIHQPRLFCEDLSCPFASAGGFRTAAQLKKHVRLYHKSDLSIPAFFPRSKPLARPEVPNGGLHRNQGQQPPRIPVPQPQPSTMEEVQVFRQRVPNSQSMTDEQIKNALMR